MFQNIPDVKLGIIAVSRDCFPIALSEIRRANIVKANKDEIYECPVTVENEKDMLKAVADVKAAECNALVVFLGNFGPETPETLIAKNFDGPCMFVAAPPKTSSVCPSCRRNCPPFNWKNRCCLLTPMFPSRLRVLPAVPPKRL